MSRQVLNLRAVLGGAVKLSPGSARAGWVGGAGSCNGAGRAQRGNLGPGREIGGYDIC